jgi:hypothetical protein
MLYCATVEGMSQTRADLLQRFRRMGLGSIAAALLEGFAPLAPLGAQGLLLLQPLFGGGETWESIARTLENPEQIDELAAELRSGAPHGQH